MDNDVGGTDYCIGFDSAVSTVAEAVDKLQTTASAHHRVMVVEAMGRDTGWVALAGAICGSAHMVVVPEVPVSIGELVRRVRARHDAGRHFTILVVAEGTLVKGLPGQGLAGEESPARRRVRPSAGELIGLAIEGETGYETRVTVLGHLQRGGSPTVHDRLMATRFGTAAVEVALEGQWDRMVALKGNRVLPVPLSEAARRRPADLSLYDLATLF
jgi:6-phosphofructokinase 1